MYSIACGLFVRAPGWSFVVMSALAYLSICDLKMEGGEMKGSDVDTSCLSIKLKRLYHSTQQSGS